MGITLINPDLKYILSGIAIVLTFMAFTPYIYSIIKGKTKPHLFSWIIWSMTTFVVFFAQLEGGSGIGAWPTGVSGVITIGIAYLAYAHRTDITITKADWLLLISALSSLPFWYFTADPLSAVIILTIVDVLGFGPTLRKVYVDPLSEPLLFYSLFFVSNLMIIMALEHYSVTTVLFPAVIAALCFLLVLMVMWRRNNIRG
jgi:hypothetical protein